MKRADGRVTVSFNVAFKRGPRGQRKAVAASDPSPVSLQPPPIDPESVPRITRMLVLGYHFESLVRDGTVKNYAEIARLTGVSRARVSQIATLTLLAPPIQEAMILTDRMIM